MMFFIIWCNWEIDIFGLKSELLCIERIVDLARRSDAEPLKPLAASFGDAVEFWRMPFEKRCRNVIRYCQAGAQWGARVADIG